MSDNVGFAAVRMDGNCLRNISDPFEQLRRYINGLLPSEPIVLVGGTVAACYIIFRVVNSVPRDGVKEGLKRYVFQKARLIPAIRREIETQVAAAEKNIRDDMLKLMTPKGQQEPEFVLRLPCQGLKGEMIVSKTEEYMNLGNYHWENRQVSGTVYHGGKELTDLNTKVFSLAVWSNPLHPDVFPGVCKMEAEVVQMCAELFHGNDSTVGTITSGGTESIILAVKAYRDYAMKVRGISNPEILVPITAHAAFDKAAELLGIRIKHVGISKKTTQVRLEVMKSMITRNTCMLVGSSPAFPHGCIDDIQGIAKLGRKYNIPVHVDACLGGFLVAFMPKAGFKVPPFDFAVEGVTSISADTHKYGFTPKGTSVLLFSDKKFKHHQYFVQPSWPGGIYASPTLAGSRPGVTIAGCWSTLLHFGMDGYVETTRKIITAARKIEEGLRDISEIYVLGQPTVSVVAFGSHVIDVYRVAEKLNKKGWNLNNLQFPSSVHICVTMLHTEEGIAEQFVQDVTEVVKEIKMDPTAVPTGAAALYASSQQIPDRSLVGDIASIYLDALYNTRKTSCIENGSANGSAESLNGKSSKPKRKTGVLHQENGSNTSDNTCN